MPKTINLKDLSIPELKVEAFDRLAWEQKNKKELDMILAEISSRNDQKETKPIEPAAERPGDAS